MVRTSEQQPLLAVFTVQFEPIMGNLFATQVDPQAHYGTFYDGSLLNDPSLLLFV